MAKTIRRKPFRSHSVLHLYQNTVNGYLLFYTRSDFLVFFSLINTAAERWKIRMIGLCMMPDHVHLLLEAGDRKSLCAFVQEYSARYVRAQNQWLSRKGTLFNAGFGTAVKLGNKAVRTAIAYLYNNPVEKKLCERAEDYRWSFLASAGGMRPFSEPLVIRRTSPPLRRALRETLAEKRKGQPLTYAMLERLFRKLDKAEREQLTDWIINIYSVIDSEEMLSYYGSYDAALTAMNANTGSEYDIKEDREVRSDVPYQEIARQLLRETGCRTVDEVLRLPEARRRELCAILLRRDTAPARLVEKYLRLPPLFSKCVSRK